MAANKESLKAQPADPAPRMTEAEWLAEAAALIKRGEDSGLNMLALATHVGFGRGRRFVDGILATVENSIGSGGKKG